MSLKAIHIFFVTVATLISGGFAVWTVQQYSSSGGGADLFIAILAVALAVGLPIYGVWFLKKMKHVGYV